MREVVTDYETKVETVEKEHEVVYCDVCGGQCTGTHEVVPMELCPGCQPDEEDREWSLKEYRRAFEDYRSNDKVRMTKGTVVMFTVLFPVFLGASMLDAADDATDNAARWFMIGSFGVVIWIALIWVLSKIAMAIGFVPT